MDNSFKAVDDANVSSWRKNMEDSALQVREYMKHNANFQRQLVSVRESRALLEQNHRMREERATHLAYQFRQILWQMRRTQDDVYAAQERNLKLLQFVGRHPQLGCDHASGRGKTIASDLDGHDVSSSSQQVPAQSEQHSFSQTNLLTSPHDGDQNHVLGKCDQGTGGEAADLCPQQTQRSHVPCPLKTSSRFRYEWRLQSASLEATKDQDPHSVACSQERANLDLEQLRGSSFPTSSTATKDNYSIGGTHKCLMNAEDTERQLSIPKLEDTGSQSTATDVLFVKDSCGKLEVAIATKESLSSFLEQNSTPIILPGQDIPVVQPVVQKLDKILREEQCQEVSMAQEDIDKNDDGEEPVIPLHEEPWVQLKVTANQGVQHTVVRSEERKQFLKVEKNFFLSERGFANQQVSEPEIDLNFFTKPIPLNAPVKVGGVCMLENMTDGTAKIDSEGSIAQGVKDKRKSMILWSPEEKIAALSTVNNTMFLWDDKPSHFGNWPENEIILSAAFAAKDNQQELFELLEATKDISRPMTCCGVVCELLKTYPPEKLLPWRFIEDFFISKDTVDEQVKEGVTFDHLEVYQEREDAKFWQMLVQHAVYVKDHNLASLRQVAHIFTDILFPSTWMMELQKSKDLHQDLLEFLVRGFKFKILQEGHVQDNDNEHVLNTTQNMLGISSTELEEGFEPLSKDFREKDNKVQLSIPPIQLPQQDRKFIKDVIVSDKDFRGISLGYKTGKSGRRHAVARKGILSCFGSMARTPFRKWRLKALSKGVETVDEAVVRLWPQESQK